MTERYEAHKLRHTESSFNGSGNAVIVDTQDGLAYLAELHREMNDDNETTCYAFPVMFCNMMSNVWDWEEKIYNDGEHIIPSQRPE